VSTNFGWSLPPGVTTEMIDRAYGYDQPDREIHKCSKCGAFLRNKPDRTENWEAGIDCTGIATAYEAAYTEGLIEILGEEYRGRTYTETITPCGEERAHDPHTEIYAAGTNEFRRCSRCGTESMEEVG
jgi:hypothetical protein